MAVVLGDALGDHAALVIVGVGEGVGVAVRRGDEFLRADEAVLPVPCVSEAAVGEHVAVGVVGKLFGILRHEDAARDGAHLVPAVGRGGGVTTATLISL